MLIIDIIIFLVVSVALTTYLCQSNSKEHFIVYTGKDCENIGIGENRCSKEEQEIYDIHKKLREAKQIATPRSPLSSRNYKKFFKKKTVGQKPKCYGHQCHYWEGRGKKEGRDKKKNFLKHINDYGTWLQNKKLYRGKEIPIEMSFYDTLKKVDGIIGKDIHPGDLRSDKKLKNKKHLKRLIPKMIRAKIIFKKKYATFIFKLEPAHKKNLYWINVSDENEFFYIEDMLKENNVVVTTNELC